MTRRSYHIYIFRVDEKRLGMSRDQFIEALIAEGVPAPPKAGIGPFTAMEFSSRAIAGRPTP